MTRNVLAALGLVLTLAVAGSVAFAVSPAAPVASAYVLANECDEYDPARAITYRCVPSDKSIFYTPDGIDATRVPLGAGYRQQQQELVAIIGDTGGGIPPPAPYVSGRDYCSNPWFGWSPFEGGWQRACYTHDVCYGSQLGRKFCDVHFWVDMQAVCRKNYGAWYQTLSRYACLADARIWYYAAVWFGGSHYKPRASSSEPRGE